LAQRVITRWAKKSAQLRNPSSSVVIYKLALKLDKRQKPKVYNDVYGRLYVHHTTKTAKIKKKGTTVPRTEIFSKKIYDY